MKTTKEIVIVRNIEWKRVFIYAAIVLAVIYMGILNIRLILKDDKIADLEESNSSLVTTVEEIDEIHKTETDALIENYKRLLAQKDETIDALFINQNALQAANEDLEETIKSLCSENTSLVESYNSILASYNTMIERSELFDKYEYAVIYEGVRTAFNYEDIKYAAELATSYGYSPHLLFAIYSVESGFNPKCTNPESTARGIGQVLKGTAGWVYTEMLGRGKYDHDMAFDVRTNIDISATYIKYLLDKYNGDVYLALKGYRGRGGEILDRYIAKMNNTIKKYGTVYTVSVD